MNLLLDTHVALWVITDHPNLSATARELILSPRLTVWISATSIWEISIKHSLGRGEMSVSGDDAIRHFRAAGYPGKGGAGKGSDSNVIPFGEGGSGICEPPRTATVKINVFRRLCNVQWGFLPAQYPSCSAYSRVLYAKALIRQQFFSNGQVFIDECTLQ